MEDHKIDVKFCLAGESHSNKVGQECFYNLLIILMSKFHLTKNQGWVSFNYCLFTFAVCSFFLHTNLCNTQSDTSLFWTLLHLSYCASSNESSNIII